MICAPTELYASAQRCWPRYCRSGLAAGRRQRARPGMDDHRRMAAWPGDRHFLRDHRLDPVAHVAHELVGVRTQKDLRDAVGERVAERDIGLASHVGHLLDRDPGYVGEHQEPVAL